MDAGWAKLRAPTQTLSLRSQETLNDSSAGVVFRLNDSGYYAFLLSTSAQAYKADELSFKLVKRTFRGTSEELVPWTRLPAKQIQQEIATGIKLTVECRGDQISLFVDDQQVGHARDTTYDSGYIGLATLGTARTIFRSLHVEGTR